MRPAILVVEDDLATRTLLTVLIQRAGFDVDVVSDGMDAITLLSHTTYSAVLTDLYLPGKSGAEILEFVEKRRPDLLPRSIMVSAAPSREIDEIRARFNIPVLRKPFELGELSAIVNSLIDTTAPLTRDLQSEFCRRSVLSGAKAGVVVTPADPQNLDVPISFGYTKDNITLYLPLRIDAPFPICEAYREGRGVWVQSPELAERNYPNLSTTWRDNHSYAVAALPLVRDDRVIGVAGWTFRSPRLFSVAERKRFEEIAAYLSRELNVA